MRTVHTKVDNLRIGDFIIKSNGGSVHATLETMIQLQYHPDLGRIWDIGCQRDRDGGPGYSATLTGDTLVTVERN